MKLSPDVLRTSIEALSLIESERVSLREGVEKASALTQNTDTSKIREARRLTSETLTRQNAIDVVLLETLKPAEFNDLSPRVRSFLRIFSYLIHFAESRVDPAQLAELGRRVLGWEALSSYELALGKISLTCFKLIQLRFQDDERVALNSFNPLWLVKDAVRTFGRKEALKILSPTSRKIDVFVHPNILKKDESEILNELVSENIHLESVSGLTSLYRITGNERALRKWIDLNLVHLQDLPSSFAAANSDPSSDKRVLFVGASPTSVISYVGQLMQNRGSIHVLDTSEKRLSRLVKETSSAGLSIVEPQITEDFTLPDTPADTVMLHAPNSRTGVFWRDPSLKWRAGPDTSKYFRSVQEDLIDRCSKVVAPGGNLVYWTRSLMMEEDECVIERFLTKHSEYVLTQTRPKLGEPGLKGQNECQRFFPHLHHCDGAFLALMKRIA